MSKKYKIAETTLDAIATPIMSMRGLTGGLTPEEMAENGNAVQENITAALSAIAEKGVTVPGDANSDDLAGLIESITGGEDLTDVLDEQETKLNAVLESLKGKAAADTEIWVFELTTGETVEKVVNVG